MSPHAWLSPPTCRCHFRAGLCITLASMGAWGGYYTQACNCDLSRKTAVHAAAAGGAGMRYECGAQVPSACASWASASSDGMRPHVRDARPVASWGTVAPCAASRVEDCYIQTVGHVRAACGQTGCMSNCHVVSWSIGAYSPRLCGHHGMYVPITLCCAGCIGRAAARRAGQRAVRQPTTCNSKKSNTIATAFPPQPAYHAFGHFAGLEVSSQTGTIPRTICTHSGGSADGSNLAVAMQAGAGYAR